MEGQVTAARGCRLRFTVSALAAFALAGTSAVAQEPKLRGEQAEISLRKTINTKKYQGRDVEGEDRVIARGDSLWRILIEEKGLPGQKFHSYIVVVRGLNPQLKNLDVLRIGDKVFIPLRPDEAAVARAPSGAVSAERSAPGSGVTTEYQVKEGEHLYQILRAQLKLTDERRLAQYYALVKDLNPERKNWDALLEGEIIRLPTVGQGQENLARRPAIVAQPKRDTDAVASLDAKPPGEVPSARGRKSGDDGTSTTAMKPAAVSKDGDQAASGKLAPQLEPAVAEGKPPAKIATALVAPPDARRALREPARENMALFTRVVEAMGDQVQQTGEEVVAMRDETVRFDKDRYPVVYSPALRQRVVIDPDGNIPASLKTKLGDPNVRTPVLPMSNGVSVQEAVGQLLARLGYQALPVERPIVIQEEGITYEAKGDWMALGPKESNKTQEVFVINLTENPGEIPEYLRSQLAKRGLHLRDVAWPPANAQSAPAAAGEAGKDLVSVKTWPRGKEEIVDALLLSYGIPFGVAETLSVELRDGLRVDMRTDRIFELSGKRTALFFRPGDPEARKALRERQGFRIAELNIGALTSRELIAKVLHMLGDQAGYREHRFAAAHDSGVDRLTVKAWGFHLNNRSMFLTDRQIPAALHRFFFEKGLDIVYFQ
jgi:hypothetical protein